MPVLFSPTSFKILDLAMPSSWDFARSVYGRSKRGIEDVGMYRTDVTNYK